MYFFFIVRFSRQRRFPGVSVDTFHWSISDTMIRITMNRTCLVRQLREHARFQIFFLGEGGWGLSVLQTVALLHVFECKLIENFSGGWVLDSNPNLDMCTLKLLK